MTREIKFRALLETNKGLHQWCTYGIGTKPHLFGGYKWITEDFQFTGLKDKNGKEIYEGDIIRTFKLQRWEQRSFPEYVDCEGYSLLEQIRQVAFRDGCFTLSEDEQATPITWDIPNDKIEYRINDEGVVIINGFETELEESDIPKLSIFEVIGNIYENPELLAPVK